MTFNDVGYQPVGTKPNERLLPFSATLKTATQLLSALAISNLDSSDVSAKAFGVLPTGALGYSDALRVSVTCRLAKSIIITVLSLPQATYRYFPSRVWSRSLGFLAVGISAMVCNVSAFKIRTALPSHRLTNSCFLSCDN